ncbi:MAG: exodeoxyribonuclease VII large subunit [Oscillospiraceae bacterium]
MNENTFSVTELNNRIKQLIDSDPILMQVSVTGELSNYKVYPSGHHYFTLKDAESSIRCVMFRSSAAKLRFRPENGMGITAVGRVSVFPRDGAYQLYCTGLIPGGMGDLHIAFEQLKKKLSAEGLFDTQYKKPLPHFPGRIAVITSGAGAAVRDIIRVLKARWPLAEVIILPVRVQGVEAPPEIVGALHYANRWKVGDLIITGRGGGSIEDLWAFNDERVARAIFESEIPVISAVGHEPDVTISDFVADLRAATPSNGAELAVPDQAEMREALIGFETRAVYAVSKKMRELRHRLDELASRRVMQNPASYIDNKRVELDYAQSRLISAYERAIAARKHEFVRLATTLDTLSPLKVFSRGFALASGTDGKIVRSIDQVTPGDKLKLRLDDGAILSTVDSVLREGKDS